MGKKPITNRKRKLSRRETMTVKRNFYIDLHKEEQIAKREKRAKLGLAPKDKRQAPGKREVKLFDLETILSAIGTAIIVFALFALTQVVDLWFELQRLQGEVIYNAQVMGMDLPFLF